MTPTIKDVAAHAGFSIATVSRDGLPLAPLALLALAALAVRRLRRNRGMHRTAVAPGGARPLPEISPGGPSSGGSSC